MSQKVKKPRRASLARKVNLVIFVITFTVSLLMVALCDIDFRRAVLTPYTRKLAALEVQEKEFKPYLEHFAKFVGTPEMRAAMASVNTENDTFLEWLGAQPSFTGDDTEYGRDSLFLDWVALDLTLEDIMLSVDLDEACIELVKDQSVYRLSHEIKDNRRYTPDEELGLEEPFFDQPAEKFSAPTMVKIGNEYLLIRCVPLGFDGGEGRLWLAFNMTEPVLKHAGFLMRSILFMLALAIAASTVGVLLMKRCVTQPVRMLAQAATEFVPEEDGSYSPAKISRVDIRSGDEIGDLSREIRSMQTRIVENTENLTRMTAEKERIHTELSMATRIQESMLPSIFPPYPDRAEFDLFASMTPAKEVGGDFYDFFLLNEDHLALVMADVSGKGVPGALFMMVSKAILKNNAMAGKSVGEILSMTNELICANNKMEMFVTVWLGILEISTGRITAANAGHEYPALTKDGVFALAKDRHSFVLGGMEGTRYKEYELRLKPGDRLFLYTDGVPEATDAENRLFGTERMLDALNKEPDASPERLLENVRRAVDAFVNGAEQFDDMTMLCLEYKGPNSAALP